MHAKTKSEDILKVLARVENREAINHPNPFQAALDDLAAIRDYIETTKKRAQNRSTLYKFELGDLAKKVSITVETLGGVLLTRDIDMSLFPVLLVLENQKPASDPTPIAVAYGGPAPGSYGTVADIRDVHEIIREEVAFEVKTAVTEAMKEHSKRLIKVVQRLGKSK